MRKTNVMKKVTAFMLTAASLSWASLSYASPRDNFVYTEFSNCAHIQRTDGGFITAKEDGSIGYYDAFGNGTDDVVGAAGGNVFNVGSENEDVDVYDPETDTGMYYTRRYYYLYDNHNRLMERLASDAYDIRQTDDYIITANMDDAIENIKIRFYAKETGACVSELPASAYRIWSVSGEDAGFDLSYLSMTKSGQFIFVGQTAYAVRRMSMEILAWSPTITS